MIKTYALTGASEEISSLVASQLSRLVFVGGSPRSGTTVVQRILDCHPEIYGGPEFDFVPDVMDLFERMRRSIQSGRIDAVLDEKSLVHAFRSLLVTLFSPKLNSEAVCFLSEKTPSNVLAFARLEECAPEAKKILVIRDPRDVVSSMLEVGRRQRHRQGRAYGFVRDTIAAVDYMNLCLRAGITFAETSSNCLVIYYEDLVSDPLHVANQIYRFIGVHELERLNFENVQFESARNRESWIDWSSPDSARTGIETGSIGVAQRQLKRSDWDFICANTIPHPWLTKRYGFSSTGWTSAARWCVARCLVSRIKDSTPVLWTSLRRRVTQLFIRSCV